jgi:hypothetical protein
MKPSKQFAAYLEARKSSEVLYGDIQKHVLAKAFKPSGRRTDCMHPSAMVKSDWCHRAQYFELLDPPARPATTFNRENVFEMGHAIHRKWQGWLQEMGRLGGEWRCRNCKHQWWYEATPLLCPACASYVIEYDEVTLNADPLMIGGHTDGWCPEDNCLIEIKSMGLGSLRFEDPKFLRRFEVHTEGRGISWDLDRMWKQFNRPLPAAYRQGQLYLYIARHFEDLDVDRITFLYEFKATQESKAFTVLYDEDVSEPLITAAKAIADAIRDRSLPAPACNIDPENGCRKCRTMTATAA